MKISELVNRLRHLQKCHGDIDVFLVGGDGGVYWLENIYDADFEEGKSTVDPSMPGYDDHIYII